MIKPRLLFEESLEFPDEIVVMASFVPAFEPTQPQEDIEVLEDEKPESDFLMNGEDFSLFLSLIEVVQFMEESRK